MNRLAFSGESALTPILMKSHPPLRAASKSSNLAMSGIQKNPILALSVTAFAAFKYSSSV